MIISMVDQVLFQVEGATLVNQNIVSKNKKSWDIMALYHVVGLTCDREKQGNRISGPHRSPVEGMRRRSKRTSCPGEKPGT
jgi:hypothetical protein